MQRLTSVTTKLARGSARRGFADFGKTLIDPCGGWKFNDLWEPTKGTRREEVPNVTDMSVSGLDLASLATAVGNLTQPAPASKVTLGRWKKTEEAHALSKKYT